MKTRARRAVRPRSGRLWTLPPSCAVAAGILPAVEPGILPGGIAVPQARGAPPGGRMPPSTAGKMPAATWRQYPDAPPQPWSDAWLACFSEATELIAGNGSAVCRLCGEGFHV
jgi:hypothetical protein